MIHNGYSSIKTVCRFGKAFAFIRVALALLVSISAPLSIFFTGRFVDAVVDYSSQGINAAIVLWFVLLSLAAFFLSATSYFETRCKVEITKALQENMSPEIVRKLRRIPFSHFENSDSMDLIMRSSNNPEESLIGLFETSLRVIQSLISIFGMVILFSQVTIWLPLAFVVLLLPMIWLDFKGMDLMNSLFIDQSERERKRDYLDSLLSEKNSLLELKLFGAIHYVLQKRRAISNEVIDERVHTTIVSQKYYAISTAIVILWAITVVVVLIFGAIGKTISLGLFVSLIGSAGNILTMSQNLSSTLASLSRQSITVESLHCLLGLKEERDADEPKIGHSISPDAMIEFRNVSFAYPGTDVEVLRDISFSFRANEKIALVGKNGSGKSTIIKLLLRLYTPLRGNILVNGRDLKELSNQEMLCLFSVVFQDFNKYSLSLRENVALGDISKINDDKAIIEAVRKGSADGVFTELQENLDMTLGKLEDDGRDISEGQWQRVAIARACISESRMVLLDEPTSALDPKAESQLYESWLHAMKDRGSVIVTHRLGSARMADRIIVIDDGTVIESGRHEALIAKQGRYAQMFAAQSSWYNAPVNDG